MSWSHTSAMDQKTQFISDYLRDRLSITARCALYGMSRKTGYKGLDRYLHDGPRGLEERSRTPGCCPRQTPDHVVAARIALRQHHPAWGAKKRLSILQQRHPHWHWPARSTVCDSLGRNGLIPRKRQRRHHGIYGYPLTVADGYSRFLLGGQALSSPAVQQAKPVLTRLCNECGLPRRIRTDNGVPLATNTLARLSHLSAWWVRLGLLPEFLAPGKPQPNGRHERMHRPRTADTTRPPAATSRAPQRTFKHFREEFNTERPPEALAMPTPASVYEPSPRAMPAQLPPLEYPDRFEVRYVSANGGIRWHRQWGNVSPTCAGEYVGREDLDDGVWNVSFGPLKRGRLLERHMNIADEFGRLKRKMSPMSPDSFVTSLPGRSAHRESARHGRALPGARHDAFHFGQPSQHHPRPSPFGLCWHRRGSRGAANRHVDQEAVDSQAGYQCSLHGGAPR
jgi:putative transposase